MSKRSDSQLLPFHYVYNVALVAGVANISGSPTGLSPRALVEADTWARFRLRSLKFRLHPNAQTSSAYQIAIWVPGVQDVPPATLATAAEALNSAVLGGIATVPTNWVTVNKRDLAGPFPWYKAIPGAADVTEESPGALVVIGTSTETFVLEYSGVFEFNGALATANSPAAVQLRRELRTLRTSVSNQREKERLISLLATSEVKKQFG
jgi:hypothetical protein